MFAVGDAWCRTRPKPEFDDRGAGRCWGRHILEVLILRCPCWELADIRGVDTRGVDTRGDDARGVDTRDADIKGVDIKGADARFS